MSDLELCYLPATEAIERFKAKTLSPVELLEALQMLQTVLLLPLRSTQRAESRRELSLAVPDCMAQTRLSQARARSSLWPTDVYPQTTEVHRQKTPWP